MSLISVRLSAFCLVLITACLGYSAESHATSGVVFVNNVPVLKILSSFKGISPDAQASAMSKALRLATPEDTVKVVPTGKIVIVKVGSLTIRVQEDEAVRQGKPLLTLADSWAKNLQDALTLPEIKFGDPDLLLPLGAVKSTSFVGSLAFQSIVTSSNPSVISVTKGEGQIKLKSIGVGDADVIAEAGNVTRRLSVRVRNVAAMFPQALSVEVVGNPVNGSTVAGAIEGAIRTKLEVANGAKVTFAPFRSEALGLGKTKTYSIWTKADAAGTFPAGGFVDVKVSNLPMERKRVISLWYSNMPESIKQIGNVFSSELKPQTPIRFLYHHINASSQPMLFRVEAINDSDSPARVLIQSADTGPDRNPVAAGMGVAVQFLKYWSTQSGEIVTVPARSTIPISFRRLSPTESVSGLCTLNLISGPTDMQVRADALPPFDLNENWYNATFSHSPWHAVAPKAIDDYDRSTFEKSDHIYPNPYKVEELNYSVGGRFGSVMIGQKPISGEDHTNNLDGNYGVLYTIHTTLKNPTSSTAEVEILLESSAGYTGGLFLINGQLIQTPCLGPKATHRVLKVSIGPGASKSFDIVTVPISGGAYPVTVTARPIDAGK